MKSIFSYNIIAITCRITEPIKKALITLNILAISVFYEALISRFKFKWGQPQMYRRLHKSEQMIHNCTCHQISTRLTHTVNIYFTSMTASLFTVDPHASKYWTSHKTQEYGSWGILRQVFFILYYLTKPLSCLLLS